jgi:para-nitrobenzyl esterase
MTRACLAVSLALLACSPQPRLASWTQVKGTADDATRRHLTQGDVVGFVEGNGAHAWLGLPYAAPPTGPLRWKPPQPAAPWEQVREATRFGALCPQLNGPLSGHPGDEVVGDEDCLTLNVYAPKGTAEEAAARHAPVMVWVHGGGNTIGTANTYGVARNLAAKYGAVVVTVNYRLGFFGWFHHPALLSADASPEEASGNYGTLDLIAALQWVQANAQAFGGDPGNVTVFGESAGGFNTFSLLASPLARGLFHRAISQSGLPATRTFAEAEHFIDDPEPGMGASSNELLLKLLIAQGRAADRASARAALQAMSPADVAAFLRAQSPTALLTHFKGAPFGMFPAPQLLRDGTVLPRVPLVEAFADPASGSHVPVLLGTNKEEFKLFMALNPKYVSKWLGVLPHIRDEAVYERDAALVSDLWKALGTDLPARALAKATPGQVYAYRFDWAEEPPRATVNVAKLLGAAHGLELGFVFDDERSEADAFGLDSAENHEARVALAHAMSSYWVQFARTGSPGRGVDGTLPEWSAADGDGAAGTRFLALDSSRGSGLRLLTGAQTPSALEQRVWSDPSFESDDQRCRTHALLFYGFGRAAGGWSPERAASFAAHCPGLDVRQAAGESLR